MTADNNTVKHLYWALHQECNQIPMAVIQRPISSMQRCCIGVCVMKEDIPDTELQCHFCVQNVAC